MKHIKIVGTPNHIKIPEPVVSIPYTITENWILKRFMAQCKTIFGPDKAVLPCTDMRDKLSPCVKSVPIWDCNQPLVFDRKTIKLYDFATHCTILYKSPMTVFVRRDKFGDVFVQYLNIPAAGAITHYNKILNVPCYAEHLWRYELYTDHFCVYMTPDTKQRFGIISHAYLLVACNLDSLFEY